MENPNEYDDAGYADASVALTSAMQKLWAAGAGPSDIAQQIQDALSDAGADVTSVEIV